MRIKRKGRCADYDERVAAELKRDGLTVPGEERKDGKREDRTRWIREWNCYTGAPCSKGTRVRGTRGKRGRGDPERGGGYHGYQ